MTEPPSPRDDTRPTAVPPSRGLSRWIVPATIVAIVWVAWPWVKPAIDRVIYAGQLASLPAPTALPVPVQGVSRQALRDTWGGARSGGRRHEGIDIFATRGRPVLSATEGIVTRTGTNTLGGNVVWVMGPGRQMHYYAHLERHGDVGPGDRVAVGTVLGYVGDTGNARGTPPHLHYGIYAAGGAINPYPMLRNASDARPAASPR
ncbi:M23 family metallopeptidase [Cupriavidus plantarum]|uniref:M23 family metallopeptidase n=1 Tax=Cupriavidus plantarum TaxID=942865 RepID=UPI0015C72F06|nr:M23 family metallopeptidase [Cupriavidus plantarum]NYI02543.1 murein DD-endopeptidase MepM/ murein hydrolase activator NlpD [Cupriavidus plantarum]